MLFQLECNHGTIHEASFLGFAKSSPLMGWHLLPVFKYCGHDIQESSIERSRCLLLSHIQGEQCLHLATFKTIYRP